MVLRCNLECLSLLVDDHRLNLIALTDIVDHIQAFHHFAEAGVVAIKVGGIVAAVADEELRPPGVPSGVGHRQYATVVVLIAAIELTIDGVTRAATAITTRATALNDKVGDDTVERQPIVVAIFREFNKVSNGVRGIFVVEFDFHRALFGFNICFGHGNCF